MKFIFSKVVFGMSEYFEFKYLATDVFYECVNRDGLTYNQAIGKCFVDFSAQLDDNDAKALAIYGTILANAAKYADSIVSLKEKYVSFMALCNQQQIISVLNDNEREYLQEDLNWIKPKFSQL